MCQFGYILYMKFFVVRLLPCVVFACLCGCAGSKSGETADVPAGLGPTECPENASLYGRGLAGSYQTALMLAQRGIMTALDSAVKAQKPASGGVALDADMENLALAAQAQLLSRLENPENVGIDTVIEDAGKFSVSACMAKANAAIPFREKIAAQRDSVGHLAAQVLAQPVPVDRFAAYKELRIAYARFVALQRIAVALGEEYDPAPNNVYANVSREFVAFHSAYALVFKKVARESDTPQSDRMYTHVVNRIAKDYPVRQGECDYGVSMELDVFPVACDTSNFGMVCSAGINLKGSTCQGDSLFVLQSSVNAQGADEPEAMEHLDKTVADGVWFEEWRKDLNKWSLK